jgi:uncharacterized protein YbjT (DUF2867 family)
MNHVLVTGATGKVGRGVVAELLDSGVTVRALVRDPGSASLPGSVEAVKGDLSAPATVEAGLRGIDTVFLLWPSGTAEAAPPIVELIANHARRVVYLSSEGVGAHTDPITATHARLEALIDESGLDRTFLRPTGFAGNTLGWAARIRQEGVVRWPYREAARSLIHERDIAAVAGLALTGDGHGGKEYVLSGPAAITHADQVRTIGEAIGKPVRYEEISREAARDGMIADGWPREFADTGLDVWAGFVTEPEVVTSTVEELTGVPARTFARWASDHAADFA